LAANVPFVLEHPLTFHIIFDQKIKHRFGMDSRPIKMVFLDLIEGWQVGEPLVSGGVYGY
jgi:hypothetical protein